MTETRLGNLSNVEFCLGMADTTMGGRYKTGRDQKRIDKHSKYRNQIIIQALFWVSGTGRTVVISFMQVLETPFARQNRFCTKGFKSP